MSVLPQIYIYPGLKHHTYLAAMKSSDTTKQSGARGEMVIVVGIGHDDTSSNPGRDLIAFHIALIPLERYESNYSPSRLWVNSRTD